MVHHFIQIKSKILYEDHHKAACGRDCSHSMSGVSTSSGGCSPSRNRGDFGNFPRSTFTHLLSNHPPPPPPYFTPFHSNSTPCHPTAHPTPPHTVNCRPNWKETTYAPARQSTPWIRFIPHERFCYSKVNTTNLRTSVQPSPRCWRVKVRDSGNALEHECPASQRSLRFIFAACQHSSAPGTTCARAYLSNSFPYSYSAIPKKSVTRPVA
jgi:hypothetical protein